MNIPEEFQTSLEGLADAKKYTDAVFQRLVTLTFDILIRSKTEQHLADDEALQALSPSILKSTYAALVSFILESAKINMDPLASTEYLKQKLWPVARVEYFVAQYQKKLAMLRHILSATSFGFPHIIDADWRLDYYLKSDTISKVNQPQYYLKLKVKDEQGVPKDVEFVCTIEQLQDIVDKLQDAAHSINRLDLA